MSKQELMVRGNEGPYGFRFFLSEGDWLSLASWNHLHDAAPESEPSENVEIGLSINGELTCWRIDCGKVWELLKCWQEEGGQSAELWLEMNGEQL